MYKIAICDDEQKYINEIKTMILECEITKEIEFFEYSSGKELLEKMPMDVNVLFLDIQMEGMDGNQIATEIKKKNFRGLLIQCSGVYTPTPETIVISPYRYIQKFDIKEKIMHVLKEILEEMIRINTYTALLTECDGNKVMIHINDIAYISRHRRGSQIHLINEKYGVKNSKMICTITFEELYENLKRVDFAFPHNSYIINLKHLKSISKNEETILVGNCVLTLARSKKKEFIKDFIEYANQKYKGGINEN